MTHDEDEVCALMAEAIAQAAPTVDVEVLIADSSRAPLRRLHVDNDSAKIECCLAERVPRGDEWANTKSLTMVLRRRLPALAAPRLGRLHSAERRWPHDRVIHINRQATAPRHSASTISKLSRAVRRSDWRWCGPSSRASIEANTDALTGWRIVEHCRIDCGSSKIRVSDTHLRSATSISSSC